MKLNLSEQFAVDANLSFLGGKSVESLCKGDIEGAIGFLGLEKERIAKMPNPQEPKPEKAQQSARIPFSDLTDVDHICQKCARLESGKWDYTIISSTSGQCDSCGSEAPLQSIMRYNQDMLPREVAPKEEPQDFSSLSKRVLAPVLED